MKIKYTALLLKQLHRYTRLIKDPTKNWCIFKYSIRIIFVEIETKKY